MHEHTRTGLTVHARIWRMPACPQLRSQGASSKADALRTVGACSVVEGASALGGCKQSFEINNEDKPVIVVLVRDRVVASKLAGVVDERFGDAVATVAIRLGSCT